MSLADLDTCQPHISFYDYFTGQPIIDPVTGWTSLDVPYQNFQLVDQLYQTKKNLISTIHIEFPSLILRPELRSLLLAIFRDSTGLDKTPRVEVYAHQPDCGDPVFAGYVVPGGITENSGVVTVDCEDIMTRGKWQVLDKVEEFNNTAADLYTRALSWWSDLVNEDFLTPSAQFGKYSGVPANGISGVVLGTNDFAYGSHNNYTIITPNNFSASRSDKETLVMEAQCSLGYATKTDGVITDQVVIGLSMADQVTGLIQLQTNIAYWPGASVPLDTLRIYTYFNLIIPATPSGYNQGPNQTPTSVTQQPYFALVPNPYGGLFKFLVEIYVNRTTVTCYLNNQLVGQPITVTSTGLAAFNRNSPWFFYLNLQGSDGALPSSVSLWRVRNLVSWIRKAVRFNPQTKDVVYYLSNNESCFNFLQLICEKDNTEYRSIFKHGAINDSLELDVVNSLGVDASAMLGFGQPAPSQPHMAQQSPVTSPTVSSGQQANYFDPSFGTPPPFRFEEGYNLSDVPKIQTKADVLANEVIRIGANTLDAQVGADVWSVTDTGNPVVGIAPLRPYIVVNVNDDRVASSNVASQMANYDLKRRLDPTSALTMKIVEQLEFAWKWRAGDKVFVKTKSLLTNLEQVLRVIQVKHTAGMAEREVVLGYQPWDAESLDFLGFNASQSWLFDQSGTSGLTIPYAIVGALLSIPSHNFSFNQPITLDQFSSGSFILQAFIHWTTDGANGVLASEIHPVIDGTNIAPPVPVYSSTDSGPQPISSSLSLAGNHTLSFYNSNGSFATNLTSAYITLQMKI